VTGYQDLFPVYHKWQRHLAFYTVRRLQPGDVLKASDAVLLEGKAEVGQPIRCGTCGLPLGPRHLTYEEGT